MEHPDIHERMESLISEMLEGQIRLDEAVSEFEKIYILKALVRCESHLSRTARALGIHRNTLSKRVASYSTRPKTPKKLISRKAK